MCWISRVVMGNLSLIQGTIIIMIPRVDIMIILTQGSQHRRLGTMIVTEESRGIDHTRIIEMRVDNTTSSRIGIGTSRQVLWGINSGIIRNKCRTSMDSTDSHSSTTTSSSSISKGGDHISHSNSSSSSMVISILMEVDSITWYSRHSKAMGSLLLLYHLVWDNSLMLHKDMDNQQSSLLTINLR